MKYYRLDPPGTPPKDVLANVKRQLAAELPAMFGFAVYSSIPRIGSGTSDIPFPTDGHKIGKHKGALLIRNSWGTNWGDQSYGWLPYAYVEAGLALDFWTLVRAEYVNTELFG